MPRTVRYSSAIDITLQRIGRAIEEQAPVCLLCLPALECAVEAQPLTADTDLPHLTSMQATYSQNMWQERIEGLPLSSEAVPGGRRSARRWWPVILLSTKVALISCNSSHCVSKYTQQYR